MIKFQISSLDDDYKFLLLGNVFASKGIKTNILVDLTKERYIKLPKEVYEVLENGDISTKTLAEKEVFVKIFNRLASLNFGFFSKNIDLFPKINTNFFNNSLITNAVLEIDFKNDKINFEELINQLESIKCDHIALFIFNIKSLHALDSKLKYINWSEIKSINVFLSADIFENVSLYQYLSNNPKIVEITIYSCSIDKLEFVNSTIINFKKAKFERNNLICGKINENYFSINIPAYTESLHHNSCLNRKISIDAEGNIKNCPSMKESYGNIRDSTLAEAIEKPGFKKYWDINKDKIAVCKDCEFRYICTDCRAYVEEPEDTSGPDGTNLSKPLKCGYNPYTGEWSEWSTNPLKQKAIDFYGLREKVDKSEK
jgi:SPASM domain peptide maturase of grasp-with-spasm system